MTTKVSEASSEANTNTNTSYINLAGSVFFDQDLGDIIYNKLMKAPVKDYQILLRLSKLGQTINSISQDLAKERDEIAKECGLEEFLKPDTALTPETLNDATYQEKSKKFWEMLQEKVFNKTYSLEPLGTLVLDLNNPDGHAKAFLEWSTLSADDIVKLSWLGILTLKDWDSPEEQQAEQQATDEQQTDTEQQTEAEDILVPNKDETDDSNK